MIESTPPAATARWNAAGPVPASLLMRAMRDLQSESIRSRSSRNCPLNASDNRCRAASAWLLAASVMNQMTQATGRSTPSARAQDQPCHTILSLDADPAT